MNIAKLISLLIFLLLSSQAIGAKMYRWIDAKGNVFYSDKIPKKYNRLRREVLNEKARVVKIKAKARTKEQFETEFRLKRLRSQQQTIIEQHKKRDKVLLSSFRSAEGLEGLIDRNLKSYDSKIAVEESNLERLDEQLTAYQKQAAALERKGKAIPQNILDGIHSTEQQIRQTSVEIDRHVEKKRRYQQNAAIKVERFQFLTQSDAETVQKKDETIAIEVAEQLGLFTCKDDKQCRIAWKNVLGFVQGHSTTSIAMNSEELIMAAPPKLDKDISLSVSKIKTKNGNNQLFLDIRCRQTKRGFELCKSPRVTRIRTSFVPFINSKLKEHHRITLSPESSEE